MHLNFFMKGCDRIYDSKGGTLREVTFFCPIRQFIRNGEGVGPFPLTVIQALLFSHVVNLMFFMVSIIPGGF